MKEAIKAEKAIVRETGEEWGTHGGSRWKEREREGQGNTVDQSDIRYSRGRETRKRTGERGREEIERACRIIEPYMVTVKYEAI